MLLTAGKGRWGRKTRLREQRYKASPEPGKPQGARAPAQLGKAGPARSGLTLHLPGERGWSEVDETRLSSGKDPAVIPAAPELTLAGMMGRRRRRNPRGTWGWAGTCPAEGHPMGALCRGCGSGKFCAVFPYPGFA